MIYISFYKKDCPNIFLYNYIWFFISYIYKLPRIVIYNFRMFKFGQFFEAISKSFKAIFLLSNSVYSEYNIFIKDKYERYVELVS